jgi:pullulanase/glycogen debranching enzyme
MSVCAVKEGGSAPLGATAYSHGVNFSVFSKDARRVELLLFDDENAARPAKIISLDANRHRTSHYWHVFVPDLKPGQMYAYRAHGPFAPERGFRFDDEKVLLDPYGLAVAVPDAYDRGAARRPADNAAVAMKSVVADPGRYDWEGDLSIHRPSVETVIYELHEARRNQRGNNDAYCQDSDISWFNWSLLERHADIHRFVKSLNAFRQRRDVVVEGDMLSLNCGDPTGIRLRPVVR